MTIMEPKDRLILALDVADREEALSLAELLRAEVGLFKVGWQLFMAEGPQILIDLAYNFDGSRIFLDLKIYDILNTLKGALKSIPPGVALVTIHSDLPTGGLTDILKEIEGGFKVLAVTLLTSLSGKDLVSLGYAPEYGPVGPGRGLPGGDLLRPGGQEGEGGLRPGFPGGVSGDQAGLDGGAGG